jgi:hypothetical protein
MRKAICTFGVGTHAELLDIARPSFRAFASRHNYDYHEAEQVGNKRPAPWYKVKCLLELLNHYDMAVFFGCDMVIVDGRADLPITNADWDWGWYQALVVHHTQCGNVPNDDMWVCNQKMIPWLERVWSLEKYMHHGWWEQAALLDLMGYDHLQVEQFPIQQADSKNELYKNTMFLPGEWNVHLWDTPQPKHPRIQHATMWPDRVAIMREWATQAEAWING